MICITNATILTPTTSIFRGCVLIEDGRITAAGSMGRVAIPDGTQVVDAQEQLLAPGFIDLQLNGAFGFDFTLSPEKMWEVAAWLPRYGVTNFLPTIVTTQPANLQQALGIWRQGPPADFSGATALGLHVEGPFLNPAKKGAHNPDYLRPPSLEDIENWWPGRGVRLVTLAPELLGAMDIIATLAARGVVVGAAHSLATFDQAREAVTAGVRYATHLFNAMPLLHHRQPGLVGAMLADERVTIGLIADGLHLHPALVKIIWQVTRDGRLNLVTDAMSALGMRPGRYRLGDMQVRVDGRSVSLPNGTLAGSILSLDQALRNLLNYTGCSPGEALQTITSTPAALLGLARVKGRIAPGYDADLVLLTPDFQVLKTMVAGRFVYEFKPNKLAA